MRDQSTPDTPAEPARDGATPARPGTVATVRACVVVPLCFPAHEGGLHGRIADLLARTLPTGNGSPSHMWEVDNGRVDTLYSLEPSIRQLVCPLPEDSLRAPAARAVPAAAGAVPAAAGPAAGAARNSGSTAAVGNPPERAWRNTTERRIVAAARRGEEWSAVALRLSSAPLALLAAPYVGTGKRRVPLGDLIRAHLMLFPLDTGALIVEVEISEEYSDLESASCEVADRLARAVALDDGQADGKASRKRGWSFGDPHETDTVARDAQVDRLPAALQNAFPRRTSIVDTGEHDGERVSTAVGCATLRDLADWLCDPAPTAGSGLVSLPRGGTSAVTQTLLLWPDPVDDAATIDRSLLRLARRRGDANDPPALPIDEALDTRWSASARRHLLVSRDGVAAISVATATAPQVERDNWPSSFIDGYGWLYGHCWAERLTLSQLALRTSAFVAKVPLDSATIDEDTREEAQKLVHLLVRYSATLVGDDPGGHHDLARFFRAVRRALGTPDQLEEIRAEVRELADLVEKGYERRMVELQQQRADSADELNRLVSVVGIAGAVAATITGVFGMNTAGLAGLGSWIPAVLLAGTATWAAAAWRNPSLGPRLGGAKAARQLKASSADGRTKQLPPATRGGA